MILSDRIYYKNISEYNSVSDCKDKFKFCHKLKENCDDVFVDKTKIKDFCPFTCGICSMICFLERF